MYLYISCTINGLIYHSNIYIKIRLKQHHTDGIHVEDKKILPTSGKFCRLLIIFANCLDTDQYQQNVRPDLDPNHFHQDTLMVFLKLILKLIMKKKQSAENKISMENYPV